MSNVTPIDAGSANDTQTKPPVSVSFEFFPPATPRAEETLWHCIQRLAPVGPRFVSVTYGAGGSTRERTHNTVRRILEETDLTPAAHLTCVSATRGEVLDVVRQYADTGVRHIVALRGDPPAGEQSWQPRGDGFANAL
ncbi:MAG: methylenetetrahydrofolate reductase, partial [Gammaproteobacteria bacterium]